MYLGTLALPSHSLTSCGCNSNVATQHAGTSTAFSCLRLLQQYCCNSPSCHISQRTGTSFTSGCCNSNVATHYCAIYLGMLALRLQLQLGTPAPPLPFSILHIKKLLQRMSHKSLTCGPHHPIPDLIEQDLNTSSVATLHSCTVVRCNSLVFIYP